jgi:branched-chain amino acid transport system substrate-binding protein
MSRRFLLPLPLAAAVFATASCGGGGTRPITIGVLSDCEGIYAFAGDPSYAGAELPLIRRGARVQGSNPGAGLSGVEVAGKRIKLVLGCGDDSAEKALAEARRLVEDAGVDILIGPLQIAESFAVHDYARKRPGTTFLDGTAAGQALTLHDPLPNLFRFSSDGAQFVAGLGTYAYKQLGWRKAITVAVPGGVADEGFEYTQVAGFVAEFCALGGTIVRRVWGPQGDVSHYAARSKADGFFVDDPTGFATKFSNLHGNLSKQIVGGIFWVAASPELQKRAAGVVMASPVPFGSNTPQAWGNYVSTFRKSYPSLAASAGGIFDIAYYDAMEAALEALERVHGDLSGGERRFRTALAAVRLDSPIGPIHLDRNRQAVAPNFLIQLRTKGNGSPTARTIRVVPSVDARFGGYFHTNGPLPSRTYPPCKRGDPPPWAR